MPKLMRRFLATLQLFGQVDKLLLISMHFVLVLFDRSIRLFQFSLALDEAFAFFSVTVIVVMMAMIVMNVLHDWSNDWLNYLLNNHRLKHRLDRLTNRLMNNSVRYLVYRFRTIDTASSNQLSIKGLGV